MKKITTFLLATITATLLLCAAAYANVVFDDSKAKTDGILTIDVSGVKDIAAKIEKEIVYVQVVLKGKTSVEYQYKIVGEKIAIPLQCGPNEYTIRTIELTADGKAKQLAEKFQTKVTIGEVDETKMFVHASPFVNIDASEEAIPSFQKIIDSKKKNEDKIKDVYNIIIKEYTYDTEFAKIAKSGYLPVIDETYEAKMGICYDYAVLFAGVLRSIEIPTKLVMGYASDIGKGEEYHAWNQVYVGGKWVEYDATAGASAYQAGKVYASAGTRKMQIVKVY